MDQELEKENLEDGSKASLRMAALTVRECIITRMVQSILVSLSMANAKEKES